MNLLDLARSALADRAAGEPEPERLTTAAEPAPVVADPAVKRRRARAFALLAEHPNWRRVVVAEAGEPVIIGIAIRDVGYGEIVIPAKRYDVPALIALLDEYGQLQTVH